MFIKKVENMDEFLFLSYEADGLETPVIWYTDFHMEKESPANFKWASW